MFKRGDRVILPGIAIGTVVSIDTEWYFGDEYVVNVLWDDDEQESPALPSNLILEEIYNSPLAKVMREDE